MSIPKSILDAGFITPNAARRAPGLKVRRLMMALEGEPDSGKTEFALGAPGPGAVIGLDRGFDAVFDNPNPPKTRQENFGFRVIAIPVATQADKPTYAAHWTAFYAEFRRALEHPDVRTVVLDGDSDSWELQRLADHGKLTGIFPQTRYSDVYASRRAMYNRAWDSGKIFIATNKLRDEYVDVVDQFGKPVKDATGENKRSKTGERQAQGYPDQDYLWQLRLRCLYRPHEWGVRIMKCKANMEMVGVELWGPDECNFETVVSLVYPHVPLAEWGF